MSEYIKSDISLSAKTNPYTLHILEPSDWTCHLFGSNGSGISYTPLVGEEPNWFWRKMQYLCFGNKWVKTK